MRIIYFNMIRVQKASIFYHLYGYDNNSTIRVTFMITIQHILPHTIPTHILYKLLAITIPFLYVFWIGLPHLIYKIDWPSV